MAIAPTGAIYKALKFDNVSSRTYGVYITGEAVYNAPERDVEMITIPGRNGSFALDNGRFQNIEVSYPAGIFADTEADFRQAISDFRNFLCSRKGYVRLQDEYNPDEYRMAVYKSGLEVDPAMLKAGEFTITFDCKPQRWLTSGEELVEVGEWSEYETESGPIVEIEATETDAVKSLVAVIEPIQDLNGYDKPWSAGAGKNKLSIEANTATISGVTFTQSADGSITVNGTATANVLYQVKPTSSYELLSDIFDIKADTAYILSGCPSGGSHTTYRLQLLVYGSGNEPYDLGSGSSQFSFTASDISSKQYRLCIRVDSGTACNNLVFKPMVRLASVSDATWQPYENLCPISGHTDVVVTVADDHDTPTVSDTYTTALGTTVYGGTLDVTSGVLTVTHGYVDLGSLTWNYDTGTTRFYSGAVSGIKIPLGSEVPSALSDRYVATKATGQTSGQTGTIAIGSTGWLWVYDTNAGTSGANFKTAVTGSTFVYELATPTTTTLTAQQIDLLLGTNNIWADTGDVTLEYGQNPNVVINPTLFESSPLLEIEGTGDINFNGFTVSIETSDIGNVTIPYTKSGGTFTLDLSQLDTGDTITVSGVKVASYRNYRNYATVHMFHSKASSHIPSGWSYRLGKDGSTASVYVNLPDITLSKGTAYTSDTAVIDCSAAGMKISDGTTITWTTSNSITFSYDGTSTITISHTRNDSLTPTTSAVDRTIESITGYSTIPYDFGVIFCDTDIGEFYRIEGGEYISMNHVGDLGSDLPTLAPGTNTVTYDNTITELKIAPRWWKV